MLQLTMEGAEFFKLDPGLPKIGYSIEFVSANPTGPLHIGHGRGGIIGDVLGRILTFLGHRVTKEFYINDAGAQMQKLVPLLRYDANRLQGSKWHCLRMPTMVNI